MRRLVLSLFGGILFVSSLLAVLIHPISFAANQESTQPDKKSIQPDKAPTDSEGRAQAQVRGKIAFVRQGQLWLRDENGERRVLQLGILSSPKWSPDGHFVAVTGKSKGPHGKQDFVYLQVVNAATGHTQMVTRYLFPDTITFKWGPKGHQLAFAHKGVLSSVNVAPRSSVHRVAAGIQSFAWAPNGLGFIISAPAHVLPDGWTRAKVYQVSVGEKPSKSAANHDPTLLFTLPKTVPGTDRSMLITGLTSMKWSYDGKWVAFIAHPTAAWSKDENRLCVLSKDGKKFIVVGTMLQKSEWFRWSPGADTLAYIRGNHHDISHGKKLNIAAAPLFKSRNLAPIGAVDNGLTWIDPKHIIVSRRQESLPSKSPVQLESSMFPSLYNIDVERPTVQNRITAPSQGVGDYSPVAQGWQKVVWVRSPNESSKGEIFVGKADGTAAQLWLEDVNAGMWAVAPKEKKRTRRTPDILPKISTSLDK
ncbi:hypothetical protein [Alicyclobacillus sp. SO9]|uniref:TolB family protein n=1 Tax=Alicyclobacillus sp. SO9 TaxID=2665646 RepID=UPI0018E76426|nr:hypothetical protein [Alicyclobacillus sp. SO9]QQE79956.1 hypothetical protein GI364_05605 [Alicyclobacillus sp. SO9]